MSTTTGRGERTDHDAGTGTLHSDAAQHVPYRLINEPVKSEEAKEASGV